MSAEQYSGLYCSADVYVMPTRGEGWGMPIAEAMAMGKAVIVTNWSGPADFVNDEVGYLLNYTLSTVGAWAMAWVLEIKRCGEWLRARH